MRELIRDSDQLLRYGGDEFCVILPNTSLEGAQILAERIRTVFSETVFNLSESTGVSEANALNITTSIGVASFPESAKSVQELVKEADGAMYEAKRSGKNRVNIATK